jgi:hypothetical protein
VHCAIKATRLCSRGFAIRRMHAVMFLAVDGLNREGGIGGVEVEVEMGSEVFG